MDQKANPAYIPRILQWRGFTSWGMARGYGGRKSPSEVQGPVGVLDEVPQERKQNVKLLYNF